MGGTRAERLADLATADAFEKIIDSEWMVHWIDFELTNPQRVRGEKLSRLQEYMWEAEKPERTFYDAKVKAKHKSVLKSIGNYLSVSARERVPDGVNKDMYVIYTIPNGERQWLEDYDDQYDRQLEAITTALHAVEEAWNDFARSVNLFRLAEN